MNPEPKILALSIKLAPGSDATPEMREWFGEHWDELETAIRETIVPKALELISLEMRHLGFKKEFPL